MNNLLLKKIAIALLVLLFIAPLIGTIIISSQSSAEAKQYDSLQLIFMGFYNLPFLAVSVTGILLGRSLHKKLKETAVTISLSVSIISSIAGSILMITW